MSHIIDGRLKTMKRRVIILCGGMLAAILIAWGALPAGSLLAQEKLPVIAGTIDIHELKRLIDIARESGFTEEQIKEITVEDEEGQVINAWEFIVAYEKRKKEEADRIAEERARVYLTPKDIIEELDKKQPQDIDKLREKLLLVD